ncbi:NeuD/PglB/VioB family sugar acetyltransferase [Parasphingorhabdus sp.]|uniref:NeuD/PglB/VioB family sugar acetyltransferase n=1 Tax=Parasphingorhabdus sp. TaxID=2709688 RepID=UPI002F935282
MTTSILYGVYGASGCGRGVAPLLEEQLQHQAEAEIVFIDDGRSGEVVNSLNVLSYEHFIRSKIAEKRVTIAIADGLVRKRLAERCTCDGVEFYTIAARQHISMKDVMVGEGAIFSPFTTVTSNIRIGDHFHCNIGSYVEHDCVIGDFVTFAPGVKCNGNVHIGDGAYIGSGAILKQGTPDKPLVIGAGATVGMGAVVTKDVAPGATVIGNPARPLVK